MALKAILPDDIVKFPVELLLQVFRSFLFLLPS